MRAVDLFGVLAVCSSLCFVWPQVVRLLRRKDATGVSATGAVWALAGFGLWTIYGLDRHLGPVTVANAQSVAGFLAAAVLARRYGGSAPRLVPVSVAVAAGLAVAVALPAEAVGWLAVAVGATAYLPQARVALRRDGSALAGVSIATYVLVAISGTLWATYGLFQHDVIIVTPNLLTVPSAVLIALRAHRHRSAAARPVDGDSPAPSAPPGPAPLVGPSAAAAATAAAAKAAAG